MKLKLMDNEILNKVGELEGKINELEMKLKPLKKEFNELTDELISSNNWENSLDEISNGNWLMTITQKGYNRNNYSYKKGFETSLEKVNENIRKVLKRELQKTETETYVKPKFKLFHITNN